MARRNLVPQPAVHVVDGFYDFQTGEARIQFDLPPRGEWTTNTALVMDASGSMDAHYRKPFMGQSRVTKFVRKVAGPITEIDSDKGITVYLACTNDGSRVVKVGEFSQSELEHLVIDLDSLNARLGGGTMMRPALERVVADVVDGSNADYGYIALLTDGKLDDMPRVMEWGIQRARAIAAGKAKPVKIELIGFDNADETQMEELDNLNTGTDVDIFNAISVHNLDEAAAHLNTESLTSSIIVAAEGRLEVHGATYRRFEGGLPQRIDANLPPGLTEVTIVVGDGEGNEEKFVVRLIAD